jgi:hypothetical protein
MSLLDANPPAQGAGAPSPFHVLTVVSAVLLALTVGWAMVDARLVAGVPVWLKPLKFALSFVVLFWTMALVEARLSPGWREGWTLRVTGWAMAAAFLSEMAYMIHQAARAEASHFNLSTPFHEAMYLLMGAGAVTLIAGVAVMGVVVRRDAVAAMGPGLREGVWLGFMASFVLTFIVAGYLSGTGGPFVGVHPEGAPVLPLMGWSGVTGDLRPAHFAALHAMQALPLLGLWLDRRGAASAVRFVRIGAAAHAALTLGLFVQALMGVPLIPLG